MSTSNNLKFTTSKTVNGKVITVKIRLNDQCKNGLEDFSITGDIYPAGEPRTDRNMISCGRIHEDIEKHFPEFMPFIRLHLADMNGVPMHAIANGFFHLKNDLGNTPIDAPEYPARYCEYYRIIPAQFEHLRTARNQIQFAEMLVKLGIIDQWKAEAEAATAELEKLTGLKFESAATRSNYYPPSAEEIEKEAERQRSGYYTPEAEAARAEERKAGILAELEQELQKEIEKHTTEYQAKKEVFLKGGEKALNNIIYYTHTKTVSFNWRSYDKLPTEFINNLISQLELPEGVTAEISKK